MKSKEPQKEPKPDKTDARKLPEEETTIEYVKSKATDFIITMPKK